MNGHIGNVELRTRLAAALNASGYQVDATDDRLVPLVERIGFLQVLGRYQGLIASLLAANDQSNLKSLLLEATFAFKFERVEKLLRYEVQRRAHDESSIDFLRHPESLREICIEMRLAQQREVVRSAIERQLEQTGYYEVMQDGNDDRNETLRLQRIIHQKVVNPLGQPIKFTSGTCDSYNVVAIEVSELHLGMTDHMDCLLAMYGDPAVPEMARRNIFGLFQEARPEYPAYIYELSKGFSYFRDTVHAVLFLWKVPRVAPINFDLQYLLVHNCSLMTTEEATAVAQDFRGAMEVRA